MILRGVPLGSIFKEDGQHGLRREALQCLAEKDGYCRQRTDVQKMVSECVFLYVAMNS